jgi:hypothetical protein
LNDGTDRHGASLDRDRPRDHFAEFGVERTHARTVCILRTDLARVLVRVLVRAREYSYEGGGVTNHTHVARQRPRPT